MYIYNLYKKENGKKTNASSNTYKKNNKITNASTSINKENNSSSSIDQCAPHIKHDGSSCFSLDKLLKISNAYNENAKNNNKKLIIIKSDKKYLIKELTARLKDVCDSQICWLNLDFIQLLDDKDILEHTFRPIGPRKVLDWLSTLDIDNIINQYYKIYNNFEFYGAVPIDFDDLPQLGIKNINFNDLINKNKTKIGFVFNLDEHYKSGSHWVALYADIDPKNDNNIYFFDSYGIPPEKRIKVLIDRIVKFCNNTETNKNKNKNTNYQYNDVRHQFEGSECGVYSINFILRLLKGETFDEITKNITSDKKISLCRQVYFNKKEKANKKIMK